jgi:5-methylcytosine-specific restriction endonuclease McrA
VQDLCVPGYTKKVRDVPAEMKREVYEEYGVTSYGPGDYEVDHLIPLELGGSNSIKNLWPESHRTSPWNAQVKDRLESKLHELVCSGRLDLKTAQ